MWELFYLLAVCVVGFVLGNVYGGRGMRRVTSALEDDILLLEKAVRDSHREKEDCWRKAAQLDKLLCERNRMLDAARAEMGRLTQAHSVAVGRFKKAAGIPRSGGKRQRQRQRVRQGANTSATRIGSSPVDVMYVGASFADVMAKGTATPHSGCDASSISSNPSCD